MSQANTQHVQRNWKNNVPVPIIRRPDNVERGDCYRRETMLSPATTCYRRPRLDTVNIFMARPSDTIIINMSMVPNLLVSAVPLSHFENCSRATRLNNRLFTYRTFTNNVFFVLGSTNECRLIVFKFNHIMDTCINWAPFEVLYRM